MKNLRSLGDTFKIAIPTDEGGYLGRECPNPDCRGYFKIVVGTGLMGVTTCHCPYCGSKGDQREFYTRDQVEYAKSVVIRKIGNALLKRLTKN